MLPVERKMRIVQFVKDRRIASIIDLSRELHVSETTIRRDIAEIEEEGLLKRTYGGVILDSGANVEQPFAERSMEQVEQKERIGRLAAELVNDGDHIILDSGTTIPFIARHLLSRRNLTVITPDMNVAIEMRECKDAEIIVTGGTLYQSGYVLNGMLTSDFLKRLHVQKVFLSAQAVHSKHGITQTELELAQSKRAMVECGQQIIVCADSTKIGKVTLHTVAEMDEVHTFVTGREGNESQIQPFLDQGVRVIQA